MPRRPKRRSPLSAQQPTPLYAQVKRRIVDELLSSSGADRLLPSERELAQQLGVSRVTLRRALSELEAEGLVESSPGRGWYGTGSITGEPPNTLLSFTEIGQQSGLRASSVVLVSESRPATLDEANSLGIAPGSMVFHLRRVRRFDDIPIALDESLIPLAIAPGIERIDFVSASLYATLTNEFDVRIARADYALEAISADPEIAEHLDLVPGKPVLRAQQVTYDESGTRIERATTVYRGDRYRFRASLTRALRPSAPQ